MAEEAKKAEEASAKNRGGVKGLIIALIVLLLILLGGLVGGGYYLYSQGILDRGMDKKIDTEKVAKGEDEKPEGEWPPKLYPAKFENIVLNITKNNGKNALLKLAYTIKSEDEEIETRAKENSAEIMDAVISIISTKTAEELRTLGGKEVLKEELLSAINNILNTNINEDEAVRDGVKKIFFVNFVIK